MRGKFRHRQRFLWAVLIILIVAAYLEFGLLPGKLKEIVTTKLEDSYDQAVTFDRVIYIPFQGITIYDLKVAGTEHIPDFTAERLILQMRIWPYLREKKIVLTRIILDQPVMEKSLDTGAPQNLAEIIPPAVLSLPGAEWDLFLPRDIEVHQLNLKRARVKWVHPSRPEFTETLHRLNLELNLEEKPFISFRGNCRVGAQSDIRLYAEGRWNLNTKNPEIKVKGFLRRIPAWLKPFLNREKYARIERLVTPFEFHLRQKGTTSVYYDLTTNRSEASLIWNRYHLDTEASLAYSGICDLSDGTVRFSEGTIDVHTALLKGLPPPVEKLENLNGRILFSEESIRFENLKASSPGMQTTLSGSLDLKEPRFFDINIRQTAERPVILAPLLLSSGLSKWLRPEHFKGEFHTNARFIGDMENMDAVKKTAKIEIRNASWQTPDTDIRLTRLNGENVVTDDQIRFENFNFLYEKTPIRLDGFLSLIPGGESKFSIRHPRFTARPTVKYDKDVLDIPSLEVLIGRSRAVVSGAVQNMPGVPFRFKGDLKADFGDLAAQFEKELPWLGPLKPRGHSDLSFRVEGRAADHKSIKVYMRSDARDVRLYDKLDLQRTSVDIEYAQKQAKLTYGKTHLFGGETRFTGEIDFANTRSPFYHFKLYCLDADLSRATGTFDFLHEDFAGSMALDMEFRGIWGRPDTIRGLGNFEIANGHLFTTTLYKRLQKVLFVTIEGMDQLTFQSGRGDFVIAEQAIHSENTLLSSPLIDLSVRGKIGFDQSLDLHLNSRFTSHLIEESQEMGGLAPYLINYAERQIAEYTVTGSLGEPVYTKL